MKLRGYQLDSLDAIVAAWADGLKPLIEMATGTGKTIVFGHACAEALERSLRVMVVAHRGELIEQAATKIKAITGVEPAIEKADSWADEQALMGKAQIIVASVQSLNSRDGSAKRMNRFDPSEFGLLVFDEAHHSTADTWLAVATHFLANKNCKLLGVTATPDRNDDRNLGLLYDRVAYRYHLHDAIRDGYLVPLKQRSVVIQGIDFAKVKTKKAPDGSRDFVESELEAVMVAEKPIQQVASATIELAYGLARGTLRALLDERDDEARRVELLRILGDRQHRRTLVFCVSVVHAHLMADILNRWLAAGEASRDLAVAVDGGTDPDDRRTRLDAFRDGSKPFLCNCMIATEGFDVPSVEIVVIARPTKSRSLLAQMVGRGTRPLTSIADALSDDSTTSEQRRAMIASSAKPFVEILDFTDNTRDHDLVTSVELIAPSDLDEAVIDRAKEIAAERDIDADEAIEIASEDVEADRAAAIAIAQDAAATLDDADDRAMEIQMAPWRRKLVGAASYEVHDGATGGTLGVVARGGATEKQIGFLVRLGVRRETAMGYSLKQASAVISDQLAKRRDKRQTG